MLTWSPHSGDRPDTSPKIAVDYMLNSAVRKTIAEQPLSLQRDPQPELLLGDKDIFPLGHVDKWRIHRRIEVMSMKPRKLWAVLS